MSNLFTYKGKLLQKRGKLANGRNCCCCQVAGLNLDYSADHCCYAAIYDVYIKAQGGNRVKVAQINLNGCELVIADRITITEEQAAEIVDGAESCCLLEIDLDCATPPDENRGWGLGKCHPDLASLIATTKNGIVLFNGVVGENPTIVDICNQPNL